MAFDAGLEIFHGRSSPAVTHVYVRLADGLLQPDTLRATITGPYCRHARTLPTTVSFRPYQEDLWEAVFPDLCFWTSETPHWYRVSVTGRDKEGREQSVERMWSARNLVATRGKLYWNEQHIVLRIVRARPEWTSDLAAWREYDAAMLVDAPDEALCRAASEEGVVLCARVADKRDPGNGEVARLARWPAVAMLLVGADRFDPEQLRRAAPNTLIAREGDETNSSHDAAQPTFLSLAHFQEHRTMLEQTRQATFVMRSGEEESLAESRYSCDALLDVLGPFPSLAGVGIW